LAVIFLEIFIWRVQNGGGSKIEKIERIKRFNSLIKKKIEVKEKAASRSQHVS
jgi:hypothetical protein